ncbi:MAG: PAS domain-containing protein, partial [Chloroflexota bacterium]
MRITDVIDVADLRELNHSLRDALGTAVALTDEKGLLITASLDWDGQEHTDGQHVVIPVCIEGVRVATWELKRPCADGRNNTQSYGKHPDICHDSSGRSGTACELLDEAPAVQEGPVALVSSIARMTAGCAHANLGLLQRVHQHAEAALDATGEAVAMRRLVDSSPVGLLELNSEGFVSWANEPAREILGIEHFE